MQEAGEGKGQRAELCDCPSHEGQLTLLLLLLFALSLGGTHSVGSGLPPALGCRDYVMVRMEPHIHTGPELSHIHTYRA